MNCVFFFFFKQKTAYEMRISDWSSDVCSSDLLQDPSVKYRSFPQVDLPDRQWPGNVITKAPRWLSTDMRDDNQALIDPMDTEKKQRFFAMLVKIGIKEIEVGFPSAGPTEFDFISGLIQSGRLPDDVLIQVLTQEERNRAV